MAEYILEMRNITKEFPGVKALSGVNLKVRRGRIHALVGENGAGKSTLMKILSAVYPWGTYEGDIVVDGRVSRFKSIKESEGWGVGIIHQELALVPELSIAENLFLGNERARRGVIDWNRTTKRAMEIGQMIGLREGVDRKIKTLGLGKKQLVEIAKALAKDTKLLILDEPTAALNERDSEHLLKLLVDLKKERNITSILISHKLHEITAIADEVTILRDGEVIETLENKGNRLDEERIIKGMVGREIGKLFPQRKKCVREIEGFRIENWNVFDPWDSEKQVLFDINLHVKEGEVVGISGLMGAGRTELAMSIFGKSYGRKIRGKLFKKGREIVINSVPQAIKEGLAYLTEDRKEGGLILIDDIKHNISLANLRSLRRRFMINGNEEIRVAEYYRDKLRIKSSSIVQKTGCLSGGNQQKVVFSKWLFTEPAVLFLDEPTRGIDVGAKYEIYSLINELAEQGKSILVLSSELHEILGLCDRVYVMSEGRIVGQMSAQGATQEEIMSCIMKSSREVANERS